METKKEKGSITLLSLQQKVCYWLGVPDKKYLALSVFGVLRMMGQFWWKDPYQ